MIDMTGAYVMDQPWLWFAGRCAAPERGARISSGPKAKTFGPGPSSGRMPPWWAEMSQSRLGPHPLGPWGPLAGPSAFGSAWGRGWRSPKARKGDVRAAILAVLADAPRNGYQIIQEIAERSGGNWKPSPGSIYPTLQQLEDEGLVRADAQDGKRTYALTEDGRRYVDEHAEEVSAPWQTMADGQPGDPGFKPLIGQIAAAIWQVAAVGTEEQHAKARAALLELRRTLHAIMNDTNEEDDRR